MSQLNSGTILLAFVAVLCGLGGTYALRLQLRQPPIVQEAPPPAKKRPTLVTVPLASRDISSGTQISLDDVALYKLTREEIKATISESAFMTNPKQIVGKILLNDLKKGKPFNTQDFYPTGKSPGIANRLAPGLRAITVLLDPSNALRGFAGPGQNVDILFHYGDTGGELAGGSGAGGAANQTNTTGANPQHFDYNPPRNRDYHGNTFASGYGGGRGSDLLEGFQSATSTLVQDAEILALGRQSIPTDSASGLSEDQKVAVTLAVSPREAELLRVADGHGELSLTLRGPKDDELVQLLDPVTLNEIINVKNSIQETDVYRGKRLSKLKFAGGSVIQRRVFDAPEPATAGKSVSSETSQHPSPVPSPSGSSQQPTFVPNWSAPPAYYPNQFGNPNQASAQTDSHNNRPQQINRTRDTDEVLQ